MAGKMSARELASYVAENWTKITGRPERDMHQEGHWPEEVLALVKANELEILDF